MDSELKMIIISTGGLDSAKDLENLGNHEGEAQTEKEISLYKDKEKEFKKIIKAAIEIESENKHISILNEKENDSNNIFSNLSISEEISMSYKKPKNKLLLSPDVYRCHLCKELLTTKITKDENTDFINIDYNCPNHHLGSLDIALFLSKITFFTFIFAKCSRCGKKQQESIDIFHYCKDCEEILCQNHIVECKNAKDNIVSLEDLDYLCITHKKDYISYCEDCNENLCQDCIEEKHNKHKMYDFKDKVLDNDENSKINIYIKKGKETKNAFEKEMIQNETLFKQYNCDKIEESFLSIKNNICEKIRVYGNLIFYAYCIKKAYDFSFGLNRYNHQIITNLYELVNNQLGFIENKYSEIDHAILQLRQSIFRISLKSQEMQLIRNKEGIRIKDQIINNSNNNIKINPETLININSESTSILSNNINNDVNTNNNTSTNNNEENKRIIIKKYIFDDGEYEGEVRDGLPHGQGSYKFKNGDEYKGEFKNGLFDGNGEHTFKKGEKYSGEFKKGKREGNGNCKYINGESYSGYWKDDKKDGEGKYCFSNGDSYQGEFKEDMFNGKGTMFYSNGNRTIGMWENNKRNGIEFLFNNKGEIFFHFYENNTLMQEKKLDSNQKDFRCFTDDKMLEHMNNFYQKHMKKNK